MPDIFKFDTVVPAAFQVAKHKRPEPARAIRLACRDLFRREKILRRIIPTIEQVLAAGEMERPSPHAEAVPVAIPNSENMGDVGHRS